MSTPTSIVTVAGAGTGKTHALVERYLWALLGLDGDEPRGPERLLAITFTDKAAHEMRARLQRRLRDVRFAPEQEAEVIDRARAHGRPIDNAVAHKVLDNLRRGLSGAPIFTFHAFCARLLRDHALAAGLDPAFIVLEPDDEQRLLAETAEACIIDALQAGAHQAVTAELVARVQLHGFGEGKGLVECLVDLHGTLAERGLHASALPLAPALSRTGPEHQTARVQRALHDVVASASALRPLVSGHGSARISVIAEQCTALAALRTDGSIDDPEAALSRAFGVLREHVGGNWGGNKITTERRALVAAVDVLGAALVDELTCDLAPVVRWLLVELDVRQRREKHARGYLAFGDLLLGARDLLRGSHAVCTRVRERFVRVFVDEYQDTSPVQEEILALLHAPLPDPSTEAPHAPRRFVVGDPKQSIYGFRGADAQIFTRALEDAQRVELTVSRRSTPPVVALANLIAAHALPRGAFGVDRAQLVPLTSMRVSEHASAGEHWLVAPRLDDAATISPHELESMVVARRLREHIDAGHFAAGDVAILVRRGKAAVPLARALGRAGIAAVVIGGDGFFVRPEVADVVAALTLAADPTDELAVLTVLRSPLVGTPDDAILGLYQALPQRRGLTWPRVVEHIAAVCAETHVHSAGADSARAGLVDRVRAFDAVLATVNKRLHEGPLGRAIDALLDDGRYAAACAVEHDGELRLRNLEKLRYLVTGAGRGARSESALVAVARLAAALEDPPPEPLAVSSVEASERGAVRIMTIHQSKGLEFPVVVLADAGSALKGESDDIAFDPEIGLAVTARGRPIASCAQPSGRGRAFAPTAIQAVRRRLRERSESELARLLYVAVTRARDRLFVVGAPHRPGPGTLLGMLELVRASDGPALDALLPRAEVVASLVGLEPRTSTSASAEASALTAAPPLLARTRMRVRASDLGARLRTQTAMGFMKREPAALEDDERLPPRAAGRLAHALVALVASERRDALVDSATLHVVLRRAARACGALEVPAELLQRCAVTLEGPLRQLLQEGYALSFEESLWLEREDVVVEGKADLIARAPSGARGGGRTLVVELKLTAEQAKGEGPSQNAMDLQSRSDRLGVGPAAGSAGAGAGLKRPPRESQGASHFAMHLEAAQLQVAAYAAALEQRGEPGVAFAVWALGDGAPPAGQSFGKVQRRMLDNALASLVSST